MDHTHSDAFRGHTNTSHAMDRGGVPWQPIAVAVSAIAVSAVWLSSLRRRRQRPKAAPLPQASSASRRRVEGKVFLITGAAQGCGEGIALELAAEGAAGITVCDLNAAKGQAVVQALEQSGCRAIFVHADLGEVEACARVLAAHEDAFGRLDGLVNGAATTCRGTWDETSAETWDAILAVNVRAPFLLMQGAARLMKRNGIGCGGGSGGGDGARGGAIVNIGSVHCHGGMPKLVAYAASKSALLGLTKNFAFAHRRQCIRANYIAVGWMATPAEHQTMLREGRSEDWLVSADASHPFGRILRPRDVAKLAVHLLSDDAALHTGDCIDLNEVFVGTWE
jgi:NAD(P)-dependent dehydrogenase (short-subunit alcohol dehydrogenase family)